MFKWKRHSPSSCSSDIFGWIFVVALVELGSTSMILFPLSYFESNFEPESDSFSFISTMIVPSNIHECCARGFCGTHTTFQCPSLTSCYPSLHVAWTGFLEVGYPFFVLCSMSWGRCYNAHDETSHPPTNPLRIHYHLFL
jgi:hypothetical protein